MWRECPDGDEVDTQMGLREKCGLYSGKWRDVWMGGSGNKEKWERRRRGGRRRWYLNGSHSSAGRCRSRTTKRPEVCGAH